MPVTEIEERPGRERDNSVLLTALIVWLYRRRKESGIEVFPCQDIRVSPERTHVADVCVTVGEPDEQVFTTPPLLCIEIVSAFVPMSKVLRKIGDYLDFGVSYVWLMNPRPRSAMVYTATDSYSPEDGTLRTQNPDIALPLTELF